VVPLLFCVRGWLVGLCSGSDKMCGVVDKHGCNGSFYLWVANYSGARPDWVGKGMGIGGYRSLGIVRYHDVDNDDFLFTCVSWILGKNCVVK
jgi:hypothetical protein